MSESCTFKGTEAGIGIYPEGNKAADAFKKAKINTVYQVRFDRMRNPRFHKLMFSLIEDCYNNQERFETFEPFRDQMKIDIGFVEFTYLAAKEPSPLLRYVEHDPSCSHYYSYDGDCDCGLNEAKESDRVQIQIKTKSQSFGQLSEAKAAKLWPDIKRWAYGYIGDAVNGYEL